MKVKIEQKVRSFENKILRIIFGPTMFENAINRWRRRKHAKIMESF